ncbi:MAG: hypothetical protein PHT07_21910 [Paludibacter sp.]|nr:hypothetical protein [Paludibacter sp.]
MKPLDQWCSYSVKKFEINPELKRELIEELRIMGIDEFDVFSDLMSIGRHTERAFK